jgi:hypothetical protein
MVLKRKLTLEWLQKNSIYLAKTVEAPHHIRTRIGVGMNTSEM